MPRTDSFLQLHNSTLILLKVSKVVPKLSNVYIFTDSVPSAKIEDSPDLEAKKLVMNFYLKETCNVPLTKTFRQKISHNIKKGKCNYTDFTSDLYICFALVIRNLKFCVLYFFFIVSRQRRSAFSVPISFSQIASSSGGQIYTGISSLNLLNIVSH